MQRGRGFTLIELLVVIAIIGILASVVLASLNSARAKSRDAARVAQLKQVQTALEMYYSENGSYPTNAYQSACTTSWATPIGQLVTAGLIGAVPTDPINDATYCFNYSSITTSSSGWTCDGVPRSDYQWAILFSLEGDSNSFPSVTTASSPHTHCLLGPLK